MIKLTNENYFDKESNLEYCSASQFKEFKKCEAAAMADLNETFKKESTTSLLVGSYVDAHFEGTLDIFKAQHPELFKRDGSLKKDYVKAEEIINRIERDPLCMSYMNGEKQVIMTGTIEGVPFKIKIDVLHPDKIVDFKTVKDFAPVYVEGQGRLNFIEAWGYHVQGAIYQEIVYQNIGKRLPFYIEAGTKESYSDIAIINIPQHILDVALEEVKSQVVYIDMIKKGLTEPTRCEKCDYCKFTRVLKEAVDMEKFFGLESEE